MRKYRAYFWAKNVVDEAMVSLNLHEPTYEQLRTITEIMKHRTLMAPKPQPILEDSDFEEEEAQSIDSDL